MTRWRLEVVLRLRRDAEGRAAKAHGAAVSAVRAHEEALARAIADVGAAGVSTGAATVSALLQGDRARRACEQRASEARARLAEAVRDAEVTHAAHLSARREARALEALREREERRARLARERAAEDELLDLAAARPRPR